MRLLVFLLAVGAGAVILLAQGREDGDQPSFYQWLTDATPARTPGGIPIWELMCVGRGEDGELRPTPNGGYVAWWLRGPNFHGVGIMSIGAQPKEALTTRTPWPAIWQGAPKAPELSPLQICWSPDAAQLWVQIGNPQFGYGAWAPFDVKDGQLAGVPPRLASVLEDFADRQWQEDPRSNEPLPAWLVGATSWVCPPFVASCRVDWPDGRLGTILAEAFGPKWYGYVLEKTEYRGRVELATGPTVIDGVALLFLPRDDTLWLFAWTRLGFWATDAEPPGPPPVWRTFSRAQVVGSGTVQQVLRCGDDRAIVQLTKDNTSQWLLLDIGEWKRNLTPAPGKMP